MNLPSSRDYSTRKPTWTLPGHTGRMGAERDSTTHQVVHGQHQEPTRRQQSFQGHQESALAWWAGGDLNSRPCGHELVSACKADVLSGAWPNQAELPAHLRIPFRTL